MGEVQRPHDRKLIVIAVLICSLWVGVIYFVGPRIATQGSFGDQSIRYPAVYDWMLHDREDQPIRFDQFKGKPIFLNIWATWCGPCIVEMPSIARLAENPRLKGKVEFVCVATDESASPVRQYLRGKDWPMTFLRADSLPQAYLTDGIPATFAISPEGVVVGAVTGSNEWDTPEVVDFLARLAEPAANAPKK